MNYWLVKSDPETYSWLDLEKEKRTSWDGVRNYAARLHLKSMKKNDLVLFYHSGKKSEVVGTSKVIREQYPDPTDKSDEWVSVEIEIVSKLKNPVSLASIKLEKKLMQTPLLRISRLSVMPLAKEEFQRIVEMGK